MQKNILLEFKAEKVLSNLKESKRSDGRKLDRAFGVY